ncbi:helix-turn-helix domain-containing protein [Pseudomonas sp. MH2]|uniref:Helix-turn-helix domain-containing protein n=1 Tax=Pseudomonas machongensis TaxID=3110229 RepID=A0ABU5VF67_9PSED|nr:helix-turn-helix domain-containing protein [Pseudomonas sp. MH2]MEA5671339.1 helix-turn-helix domain-containing protein [Pseudomonas sp. MH2]
MKPITVTSIAPSSIDTLSKARTRTIGNLVYDYVTGEYYGEYITTPFAPKPMQFAMGTPSKIDRNWFIEEDGSISPLATMESSTHSTQLNELAPVVKLPNSKPMTKAKTSSTCGPKPQVIVNPLAPALCIFKFEQRPTPWLDEFVFGAIYTGPGVVNGKHSVSLADVKKVLRLSIISTATVASCLFNHERQPMSTRQLQRVIEAARTALRGIALYLERNPEILRSIDVQIDFDTLWQPQQASVASVASIEHPMKQQALGMIEAKIPNKTIAKALGISKNTVKRWKEELLSSHSGGVNEG